MTLMEWTTAADARIEPGSIVVAVDGGPGSSAALRWVVAHASPRPSPIVLVTVAPLEPSTPPSPNDFYEHIVRQSETVLHSMMPMAKVTGIVCEGDAADELRGIASSGRLLVIGTHTTHDELFAVGGLVAKVAASATVPVVVVPHEWVPGPGPVVVGVSDDQASDAAVDFALDVIGRTPRDVVLVHAEEVPATDVPASGTADAQRQQAAIDRRAAEIRPRAGTNQVSTVVATGDPADALTKVASDADLLVVGRRPRAALTRLLFGSVSRDAVLAATCPVAVVPGPADPILVTPDFADESF